MRCPDCGPFFDSIHGTCPLCGQVIDGAMEDEVTDVEPFDLDNEATKGGEQ